MRIAIGSDHAGFHLKGELCTLLDELRIEYRDFGTFDASPVDYPDFIAPVARAVARGDYERAVVIGGSGTGEAIVANKVRGIRCVEAADPVTARLGREHNDANVLSMGARIVGSEVARACVSSAPGRSRRLCTPAASRPAARIFSIFARCSSRMASSSDSSAPWTAVSATPPVSVFFGVS